MLNRRKVGIKPNSKLWRLPQSRIIFWYKIRKGPVAISLRRSQRRSRWSSGRRTRGWSRLTSRLRTAYPETLRDGRWSDSRVIPPARRRYAFHSRQRCTSRRGRRVHYSLIRRQRMQIAGGNRRVAGRCAFRQREHLLRRFADRIELPPRGLAALRQRVGRWHC